MLRSVRERPALAQSLQRALLMLCLLLFLGTVTTLAQKLPKSRDSVHLPAFSQFHPPGLEEIVKLQGMKYVRHMKGGWGFSGDSLSFEVNTTGKFAWKDKAFRAFKLSRDGKIIQAIQGYNTLLEVYSHRMRAVDIFEVHLRVGELLLTTGSNDAALDHFQRAMKWYKESPEAYFHLALLKTRLGKYREAISHYEVAISFDAGHLPSVENLGCLLLIVGQFDDALFYLRQARKLEKNGRTKAQLKREKEGKDFTEEDLSRVVADHVMGIFDTGVRLTDPLNVPALKAFLDRLEKVLARHERATMVVMGDGGGGGGGGVHRAAGTISISNDDSEVDEEEGINDESLGPAVEKKREPKKKKRKGKKKRSRKGGKGGQRSVIHWRKGDKKLLYHGASPRLSDHTMPRMAFDFIANRLIVTGDYRSAHRMLERVMSLETFSNEVGLLLGLKRSFTFPMHVESEEDAEHLLRKYALNVEEVIKLAINPQYRSRYMSHYFNPSQILPRLWSYFGSRSLFAEDGVPVIPYTDYLDTTAPHMYKVNASFKLSYSILAERTAYAVRRGSPLLRGEMPHTRNYDEKLNMRLWGRKGPIQVAIIVGRGIRPLLGTTLLAFMKGALDLGYQDRYKVTVYYERDAIKKRGLRMFEKLGCDIDKQFVELPSGVQKARDVLLADRFKINAMVFLQPDTIPLAYWLSLHRFVPVQIAYGTSTGSTTGILNTMDYIIVPHSFAHRDHQSYFSEQAVSLLGSAGGVCAKEPVLPPEARPGNPIEFKFGHHYLFSDQNYYLFGGDLSCLHPLMDEAILGILNADPKAKIVVTDNSNRVILRRKIIERLQVNETRFLFLSGIDRGAFQKLVRACVCVLDPFPVGPAFWWYENVLDIFTVGTPYVTFPGAQSKYAQRLVWGVIRTFLDLTMQRRLLNTYKKLKHLDDMAHKNKVYSVKEYVDKAVKFATDGKLNAAVSAAMRQIVEIAVYDGAQCETLIRSWLQFLSKATNRRGIPLDTITNMDAQLAPTARRLADAIATLDLASKQEWMKSSKPGRHVNAYHDKPTTLEDWGSVLGGDSRIEEYTPMEGGYASDRDEETVLRRAYVTEERVSRSRNFVVAEDFVAGETPLPPGVDRESNEMSVEEGMILFSCVEQDGFPHWYYCLGIIFEEDEKRAKVGEKGLVPRSHVYLPGEMPEDRSKLLKKREKEWRKKMEKKKRESEKGNRSN